MFDRHSYLAAFDAVRERSRQLFSIPKADSYYDRPIPLRNPIVFYEGHIPAFAINVLHKIALEKEGIDEQLEILFARGIDPDSESAVTNQASLWPTREEVLRYVARSEGAIRATLADLDYERSGRCWNNQEALHTLLEHEMMHQETFLYILHQLPLLKKNALPQTSLTVTAAAEPRVITIPSGRTTLGAERTHFGWDNEFEQSEVDVPSFDIDQHSVTNAAFLEFIEAGGYEDERWWPPATFESIREQHISHPHFWSRNGEQWMWRGLFEALPLPLDWPVYVTLDEARAYARWRGKRLPTEAEFHRAAYGTPGGEERLHPWGDEAPEPRHGNFGFRRWDPAPVGSHPEGASAFGVHDLVGNGWEWTSSLFRPFEGFEPMPTYREYSADFFDDQHYVLKGASPATDIRLIRRSFRNWFRPNYRYLYAKFRCVV